MGYTVAESTPTYTPIERPPEGAPNVVIIVLDDVGFAQLGCFGSDIATPAIDGLATGGLRYNRFHVTSMCSPTRAALFTGRNHHAVGMGFLTDIPIGFPGYNARIPRSAATLPRVLKDVGYSTFAVGKWHLAPSREQSASGPFDRWPLGLGFERYYGFLAGDTNQWTPHLVSDNGFVEPPRRPDEGYHLTEDLADKAIRLVLDQQHATPDKPFLLYFAPGAMHAPHQAPAEWIDAYRGRFDDGWDVWRNGIFARQRASGIVPDATALTERPQWVQAWADLGPGERRLFARMMEVFAGFLTHTDAQIGRVLSALREMGVLDNTIVLLISDNGTSAEGGPRGSLNEHRFVHDMLDDLDESIARIDDLGGFRAYNHYAWGWAWAGNTPMRLWKRYAWLGGVRTPLIVHWPDRIDAGSRGGIRPQFCHAVDLMPTVLDAIGLVAPEVVDGVRQQPVAGASLVPTFDDPTAPNPRTTQYFEMLGSRAIYHDGWKATTDHVGPQLSIERELIGGSHDFERDHWALFHLDEDFSESDDVGDRHPERLADMQALWWSEAEANNVLPLDDSFVGRVVALEPDPYPPRFRTVFRPGGGPIAENLAPGLGGGFRLVADIVVPDPARACHGIICALGDWNNGWAWYVLDGRPVVTFNLFGAPETFRADDTLAPGRQQLAVGYDAERAGGGPVTLWAGDNRIGEGRLSQHLPFRWQIGGAGLLIGRDTGFPVCDDYEPPFSFSGTILTVTVEIPRLAPRAPDTELAAAHKHE